jgi:hypothetical protein
MDDVLLKRVDDLPAEAARTRPAFAESCTGGPFCRLRPNPEPACAQFAGDFVIPGALGALIDTVTAVSDAA